MPITNFSITNGNQGVIRAQRTVTIADLDGADFEDERGFWVTAIDAGDVTYQLESGDGETPNARQTSTVKAGETLQLEGVKFEVVRVVNDATTTITSFVASYL